MIVLFSYHDLTCNWCILGLHTLSSMKFLSMWVHYYVLHCTAPLPCEKPCSCVRTSETKCNHVDIRHVIVILLTLILRCRLHIRCGWARINSAIFSLLLSLSSSQSRWHMWCLSVLTPLISALALRSWFFTCSPLPESSIASCLPTSRSSHPQLVHLRTVHCRRIPTLPCG